MANEMRDGERNADNGRSKIKGGGFDAKGIGGVSLDRFLQSDNLTYKSACCLCLALHLIICYYQTFLFHVHK